MKYSTLGTSGVEVSRVCLGTMTWGIQNTQQDADQQIGYALERGVNFFDTAEMYPTPPNAETCSQTEVIIGDWLSRHTQRRSDIVLATKIAGNGLPWIRGGSEITGDSVIQAVDASLKRLQTDYIDLFQLHWPNRTSPHFGKQWPNFYKPSDASGDEHKAQMHEILAALKTCVDAGKIKYCGLSDDTPWGINTYLNLAKEYNLPRMVSIQNEFSLLHTKDWPYVIENCIHEDVAYLPWSPLATGLLSGKYIDGNRPQGARWTLMQRHGLFRDTEQANDAVKALQSVAHDFGFTLAELALAWCDQTDGVTSTIIGATTMKQLEENIDAFEKVLSNELKQAVDSVLRKFPSPY